MALTLWQRIRVAFRGWLRRREEEEQRKREEFLAKNVRWSAAGPAAPVPAMPPRPAALHLDLDGLQVAYLDDSGMIEYYLDKTTGDVLDVRDGTKPEGSRLIRVPSRSETTETADRRAFVESLEESPAKAMLAGAAVPAEFRRLIAADRRTERAWYNFRNERATQAIESWLRSLGLR